jgi:hypothetical protein
MFTRKYKTAAAAVLAASSLAIVSSNAMAAIVCNTAALPITVTAGDTAGIYLNLITGLTGTSGAGVAGWDFNPYDRGLPGVSFWFDNDANRGAVSNGTSIVVLAAGAPIGPSSTFANTVADPISNLWRVAQTGGYMGIRVFNEGTSAMNYGWIQANTGASGFPFTINSYCYQNDGTEITAGTTPVSLQHFSVD